MLHCPSCKTGLDDRPTLATCPGCNHSWAPETSGEELGLYTQHYDGYRFDPDFATNVRSFIQSELALSMAPPAAVLDVGCGAGEFMLGAADAGYEVEGIDISEAAVAIVQGRGGNAQSGDYLTRSWDRQFDMVTMWDVMEHLPAPSLYLRKTAELLRPGGLFFAKIPFFGATSIGLSKRVPRLAGALLGFPDHVQFYSRQSLERLLASEGFQIERLEIGEGMREQSRKPLNLRRIATISAIRAVKRLSGDGNFYLFARRT